MNKNEFLAALYYYLAEMPEPERSKLMWDYEAYFAYNLQNGKSEEEIVRGLGDPARLAAEALQARRLPPPPPQPQERPQRIDVARTVGVTLVLFLLNLFLLPVGVSLWSALLAFGAGTLAAILAPLTVAADWAFNGEFSPATLFASIAATGAGILMAIVFVQLAKVGLRASAAYGRWTLRTWRGRN